MLVDLAQEFFIVLQLLPSIFQGLHINFPAGPVQGKPTAKPNDQAQGENGPIEESRRVNGKIDYCGAKIYGQDGYQFVNIFLCYETHNIKGFHQLAKGKWQYFFFFTWNIKNKNDLANKFAGHLSPQIPPEKLVQGPDRQGTGYWQKKKGDRVQFT